MTYTKPNNIFFVPGIYEKFFPVCVRKYHLYHTHKSQPNYTQHLNYYPSVACIFDHILSCIFWILHI